VYTISPGELTVTYCIRVGGYGNPTHVICDRPTLHNVFSYFKVLTISYTTVTEQSSNSSENVVSFVFDCLYFIKYKL